MSQSPSPSASPAPNPSPSAARALSFRRIRLIASLLLLAMALVLALSWHFQALHPAIPYVRAFAEAALIGGLADWFAIVALFRHPFGLKVPHTAIIPRNKARIGRSLGDFLSEHILDERSLAPLLRSLDLPAQAGRWLQQEDHADKLSGFLLAQGPALAEVWRAIDGKARLFGLIGEAPLAPLVTGLLARAVGKGLHQPLVTAGLGRMVAFLDSHREEIREKLAAHSWRWVPSWVDHKLADRLSEMLSELLLDLRDPGHRWRQALDEAILGLPAAFERHPEWQEEAARCQRQLFADPGLQQTLQKLAEGAGSRLQGEGPHLAALLRRLGSLLTEDEKWRRTLQHWIEKIGEKLLLPRRQTIGDFVAALVAGWDDRQLVRNLEREVGADLHYIRINGTLVGGLVGVILHLVTSWLN